MKKPRTFFAVPNNFFRVFSVSLSVHCFTRITVQWRERESLNGLLKNPMGPCGAEHSQAAVDQPKASQVIPPRQNSITYIEAFCGKAASQSWRYLFSEASNIDSLRCDGQLTYLRRMYSPLGSLH